MSTPGYTLGTGPAAALAALAAPPSAAAHARRITSIDALRGLVMLMMAIDHVRETFFLHTEAATHERVDDAAGAPRLAAHFCAPIFVFLTGVPRLLYASLPSGTPRSARGFLLKRGLLLLLGHRGELRMDRRLPAQDHLPAGHLGHRPVDDRAGFRPPGFPLLLAAVALVIVGGHNALAGISLAPDHPAYLPWNCCCTAAGRCRTRW